MKANHLTEEFNAHLDQFQGPLDLLLYLIKENEVEITDLPIVLITDQYLKMVEQIKTFDPDHASRFLVLAATLIEIKSKLLLPREEVDFSDIEDPRSNLIDQLLAYREFKERAKKFDHLRQQRLKIHPRGHSWSYQDNDDEGDIELGDVDAWDLLTLFQKILEETFNETTPTILAYNEIPTEEFMKRVIHEVVQKHNKTTSFRELVKKIAQDRVQLVGLFIAILELTRLKRIRLDQPKNFSDIYIVGADDLNDDESPILEGPHEEHFDYFDAQKSHIESTEQQEVTFELDATIKEDHALDIDPIFKSNFRSEENANSLEEQSEDDQHDEINPSLDVDADELSIIRQKVPDPIFDPTQEDLKLWKEKSNHHSNDESPQQNNDHIDL